MIRTQGIVLFAFTAALFVAGSTAIHADSVKFEVVGQSGGFRASVIHEGNGSGTTKNQPTSSAISDDFGDSTPPGFGLTGDWSNPVGGGVLTVDGGAIHAPVGGFTIFGASSAVNIQIKWTGGKLKFFNDGETDFDPDHVGGYLNFEINLDTTDDDVVNFDTFDTASGTFFFYPVDYANASPGPDPNKWEGDGGVPEQVEKFSLWGNNWPTDRDNTPGNDLGSGSYSDVDERWEFLDDEEGLDFIGGGGSFPTYRSSPGANTLASAFVAAGVDLSFNKVEGDTPAVPEPTTFVMWSVLGVAGLVVSRRRRKK